MRLPSNKLVSGLIALVALACVAVWWVSSSGKIPDESDKAPLALVTSLPVYWNESPDIAAALDAGAEPHWARKALEQRYRLQPLDTLDQLEASGQHILLMAQPRPLGAADNVALDEWVRGGGQVLLFADPMLTDHSAFALGDPRRPQDVALLSPILSRWGVALYFDDSQLEGSALVQWGDAQLPVNLPGTFALEPQLSDAPGSCRLELGGLIAQCTLGKGRATLVADAALFEDGDEIPPDTREAALEKLLSGAFSAAR
ncbi:MAG: ABC transporter [Sphingomonadaceae bacterium]|nr:ABC transporter [Sphingomonadaceae bacterium]